MWTQVCAILQMEMTFESSFLHLTHLILTPLFSLMSPFGLLGECTGP